MGGLEQAVKGSAFPQQASSCLAADDSGQIYVALPDGEILRANVRQQLLKGNWSKESKGHAATGKTSPSVDRIYPQPFLDIAVSSFVISSDGCYAVIAGQDNQDPEVATIRVLDLSSSKLGEAISGRRSACECTPVDAELFSARPGLQILQVSWHQASLRHFAVLSSDNTLRLYCLDDLSRAEQTFSLQLNKRRGFGLVNDSQQTAISFAFGTGSLWQSYSVYLLTSTGHVYLLCPVAPFGCSLPMTEVQDLHESTREDAEAASTTAWLNQAMPLPPDGGFAEGLRGQHKRRRQHVCPHALQEHTPALQGPLEMLTPDSELLGMMDLTDDADHAVSLTYTRCSKHCSVLLVATAAGLVAWHLVAHLPQPEWADIPPNCLVDDGVISAVRNQVVLAAGCDCELLLLVAAQIWIEPNPISDTADSTVNPPNLRILPDPTQTEQWYCVHKRGMELLRAPWLRMLTARLNESGEELPLLSGLESTSVDQLWVSPSSGPCCLGACLVGDVLTGTALVLLSSDSRLQCFWPPPPHLLTGPSNLSLPQLAGASTGQPEGQQQLTDSIRIMREKHVEYQVPAQHDLVKRIEEGDAVAAAQQIRSEQLDKAARATTQRLDLLASRLDRAQQWNANLEARVKLLTELHWSLPHPLTAAEAQLKSQELPSMSAESEQLRISFKGVTARAAALSKSTAVPESPGKAVAPKQVRNLRAALGDQSELISTAQQQLTALERQLALMEVGQHAV